MAISPTIIAGDNCFNFVLGVESFNLILFQTQLLFIGQINQLANPAMTAITPLHRAAIKKSALFSRLADKDNDFPARQLLR